MKTVDDGGNKKEVKDSPQKIKDEEMNDYDDEEGSEDESFNDLGKESGDESAEGESSDVDMIDDEISAGEVERDSGINLKGGRPKRTRKWNN